MWFEFKSSGKVGQIVMRDFMIHDGLEVCLTKPSHPVTSHHSECLYTHPTWNKISSRLAPRGLRSCSDSLSASATQNYESHCAAKCSFLVYFLTKIKSMKDPSYCYPLRVAETNCYTFLALRIPLSERRESPETRDML